MKEKRFKADLFLQLNTFYKNEPMLSPREENRKKEVFKNPSDDITCYICKLNKMNHLVKELIVEDESELSYADKDENDSQFENDDEESNQKSQLINEIRRKILNLSQREFIE
jgi:hypothetical protein